MEFKDKDAKLYDALFHEYSLTSFFDKGMWDHFIDYKDIGIKYIQTGCYEIVDKKKWMVVKLKYEI